MLNRFMAYAKDSLPSLLGYKTLPFSNSHFCCLHMGSKTIRLVYAKMENHKTHIQNCISYPYKDEADLARVLSQLVEANHMKGASCCLMLRSEHYHLIQTEALPVPAAEFQAAIRWKIRELIHFPIEEAVIDSFPIPPSKIPGARDMVMVVVAKLGYLQKTADLIQRSGLTLNVIDIPEMALRNITSLYEKDEKTTALLYFHEKNSKLLITHQKKFYLGRRLEFNLTQHFDQLALELQRSFDYFVSQWRLPLPARILLATSTPTSFNITDELTKRLSMPVELVDITTYLTLQNPLSRAVQGEFLTAIGGVLRKETETDATAN